MKNDHKISRTSQPVGYPKRFPVPELSVPWSSNYNEYSPRYYVAPSVLDNDRTKKNGGWADPEKFDQKYIVTRNVNIRHGVTFDREGYPLNPIGRTGIKGRGLLGKWGINKSVDIILSRRDIQTGDQQVLLIRRKDTGQLALPGGMVNDDESDGDAIRRELYEETDLLVNVSIRDVISIGYVDDPRNTDNAWIETIVYAKEIDLQTGKDMVPKPGDDALSACWMNIDEELFEKMYASHGDFLKTFLRNQLRTKINDSATPLDFPSCLHNNEVIYLKGG